MRKTAAAGDLATVRAGPRRARRPSGLTAALMLAPFLLAYGLFFIFPTLRAVQLSLTDSSLTETGAYVGLANYARLLGDADFWSALRNTGMFALFTVIPTTLIGLVMALAVNRLIRAKNFVQALFFLPFVLPVSVVTLLWQWILNSSFGIVNALTGSTTSWFAELSTAMRDASICGLGQAAPNPLLSILRYFPEELR